MKNHNFRNRGRRAVRFFRSNLLVLLLARCASDGVWAGQDGVLFSSGALTNQDNGLGTKDFVLAPNGGAGPAISMTKLTNGTNNDSPPGVSVPAGSTVTFTYIVTNPGSFSLSNVTVRDDNGTPGNTADDFNATFVSGDANANGLLDPGEMWTFTASRIATPGQYTNLGTATGTPPTEPNVTASNPDNHFGVVAGIHLTKLTNGTDNNSPPGPSVPVGSTV